MPVIPPPFVLDCRGTLLDARPGRAHVMGILNVTPDSFSDGGRYLDPEAAAARAARMLDEGAAIIDVGGASSRPRGATYGSGAPDVRAGTEIDRVVPVIRAILANRPGTLVSIDTVHPAVASAAIEAGASIVNDVTGLRHDPGLADIAAASGAALILMHSVGAWGALAHESSYEDVVRDVCDSLTESVRVARDAGVRSIAVDPGFGFGKTPHDNLRLLARTESLLGLGCPVLVGVSRKSTIGITLGSPRGPVPVDERLYGSLGAAAVAVVKGASLVRTHDVRETVETLRLVTNILQAGQ